MERRAERAEVSEYGGVEMGEGWSSLLGGVPKMAAYRHMSAYYLCQGEGGWRGMMSERVAYVIRSFRSLAFFRPPNAIFVPGMYFLGFSRYSNCYERDFSRWRFCSKRCKEGGGWGLPDYFWKAYQSVLFPVYCFVLVCVGVGEAFDLAGFTSEEAVEVGSDFVAFAFAEGVALGASCLGGGLEYCIGRDTGVRNEVYVP